MDSARPLAASAMNTLLGISLKILATLCFTVMGALVKTVSTEVPTGQVVFYRSFFALVPLLLWLGWRNELIDAVRTRNVFGQLRRSLSSTAGMACGFAALSYLPLPDATAIGYFTPIVTTVLAALILGETVRGARWFALLLGFSGMIVMLLPFFGAGGHAIAGDNEARGALLGLAGAVFSAYAGVEVRRLAQTERTGAIVFYFSSTAALCGALTAVYAWAPLSTMQFVVLVVAGILGGIGQILLTTSYRFAPISTLAPFDYMSLIWATMLGFLLFGDIPQQLVLVGAALVIAAGLLVIFQERRADVERNPRPPAG